MTSQALQLADDLFPAVWSGQKLSTVRTGHRRIAPGTLVLEAASGTRPDTLVDVVQVLHATLDTLPEKAVEMEGYPSRAALLDALRRFYPAIVETSPVTLVAWKNARFPAWMIPAPSQLARHA